MSTKKVRRALGALVSATLIAGPALLPTAASAATIHPVTAPLVDAAGDDSGCDVTAGTPFTLVEAGRNRVRAHVDGACDRPWARTRTQVEVKEIKPDGTGRTLIAKTDIAAAGGAVTILGAGVGFDCTRGQHTYQVRWFVKVRDGGPNPNPFKATVQQRGTVVC